MSGPNGRPPHKPTRDSRATVADYALVGFAQYVIAKKLKIDPKTLRKHYRFELNTGMAKDARTR